ncbi:MAG: LysM peptidoglycan-binding domain-containing protein [Bacteroidales bacterium]|nr:LysM peptidoglycan-binding domain-containing protein [Bacteroidales bacterium]
MKLKLFLYIMLGLSIHLALAQDNSTFSTDKETFTNDTTSSLNKTDSIDIIVENEDPIIPDAKEFHTDHITLNKSYDPIYAQLDSLATQKYLDNSTFTDNINELNIYGYAADSIPVFPDSVFIERFKQLNLYSPIEIIYNAQVKSYIDSYSRWKKLTSKMLGLAEIYFPMIEETLDKYEMPLELKYLAIVESALNPKATSRAGARGLWQFMYNTGKLYGLQVTSITEDRCDPLKSTDAACRHLKDLHQIYDNWSLALAAYNCGAGNVNKAIQRSGGKRSFWLLWPYLPKETRGYVPAFMAVTYMMNYATEHNIYPTTPGIFNYQIDTITISNVLSFDQISEVIGAPLDMIEFLNPVYKKGIIPASEENLMSLTLPREYIRLFIANEDSIYFYKTKEGLEREHLLAEIKKVEHQTLHTVKKGETLSHIAQKYRCSVTQLKSWNKLKSTHLQIGQKLVIFPIGGGSVASQKSTPSTSEFHYVKKGETLGAISQKYHCSVDEIKTWNHLSSTKISIGQKLRVKKASATTTSPTSSQNNFSTYTVKEGDNLWNIANNYKNISVEEIKNANNLTSDQLTVNQKLKIPQKN